MDNSNALALFNLLYTIIIGIIGTGGILYGGYSLWDGFTNDQPESRKKGITIVLVTVFVIVFMLTAKGIVLGMVGLA